jgi:hypothetical protein
MYGKIYLAFLTVSGNGIKRPVIFDVLERQIDRQWFAFHPQFPFHHPPKHDFTVLER